jgi:orotate phosphoribosyltransferase
MHKFDKEKYLSFILDNRVVGFFDKPITLKSGRTSHWYVNWRTVSSDVFLIDQLSDFLIDFVSDLRLAHDGFFGVPEGATKLAVLSTYKWARIQKNYKEGSHTLAMGRGKPKEHGSPKDRYFVGEPRGNVILIEDVTTTGGSLLETIDRIKAAGASIAAAIGLTNRMELDKNEKGVADAVGEKGVAYYAMSEATKILPEAIRRFNPSPEIVSAIKNEFLKYGVEALNV